MKRNVVAIAILIAVARIDSVRGRSTPSVAQVELKSASAIRALHPPIMGAMNYAGHESNEVTITLQ